MFMRLCSLHTGGLLRFSGRLLTVMRRVRCDDDADGYRTGYRRHDPEGGQWTLDKKETGGSLFDKLSEVGARLLIRTLEELEDGTAQFEKQPAESTTRICGDADEKVRQYRLEQERG